MVCVCWVQYCGELREVPLRLGRQRGGAEGDMTQGGWVDGVYVCVGGCMCGSGFFGMRESCGGGFLEAVR